MRRGGGTPSRHMYLWVVANVIETDCPGSSESWSLNSSHIHGTHVPVEQPSTASKAAHRNGRKRAAALEILRRLYSDLLPDGAGAYAIASSPRTARVAGTCFVTVLITPICLAFC